MERWAGRVALVTGASSGIGAAVSSMLVKHGMHVFGCARRLERIQELANGLSGAPGTLQPMSCDLAKEEDILRVFDAIKQNHGGVDVCVNNGGVGLNCSLLGGATKDWQQTMDVNVLALMICTREAVKSMRQRDVNDGYVIHIGSVAGHTTPTSPESNMYSTSKHTVRALTEGHRRELRQLKSSIRVSCVSPGWVETGFSVGMRGKEFVDNVYSSIECLQSRDVADTVEHLLSTPPHVEVHDVIMRPVQQTN